MASAAGILYGDVGSPNHRAGHLQQSDSESEAGDSLFDSCVLVDNRAIAQGNAKGYPQYSFRIGRHRPFMGSVDVAGEHRIFGCPTAVSTRAVTLLPFN